MSSVLHWLVARSFVCHVAGHHSRCIHLPSAFGLTTLVLQFHNVGWMPSVGPVVSLGLIFGGLAQLFAGFQEFKTGNNFGYSAFTAYGSFWISLALIFLSNRYKIFEVSSAELGFYLVAWTLYTAIM